MDSLGSIGCEQVDPKVVKLTHQRNSLEKEIGDKKKELEELDKTKIDTKGAKKKLSELIEQLKTAKEELSKAFTDKEAVLITFDKAKDSRESLSKLLESDIKKNEAKIEKQNTLIKENEDRFKSNTVELKALLETEKKLATEDAVKHLDKLTAQIEKLRGEKKSTLASNAVLSAEEKTMKNGNRKLTTERNGLEADISGLLADKEQFNTLDPELRELRKEIALAEATLEKLIAANIKEGLRIKELAEDQNVKEKWMSEKEQRMNKIINLLSKKTEDASILRMINNL